MATNTGKNSRKGSGGDRTQLKNPGSQDDVKRAGDPQSRRDGEFMLVKKDGGAFKAIAKEPSSQRKGEYSKVSTPVEPRLLPTRRRITIELARERAVGRPDDPPFDGVAFLRKLR